MRGALAEIFTVLSRIYPAKYPTLLIKYHPIKRVRQEFLRFNARKNVLKRETNTLIGAKTIYYYGIIIFLLRFKPGGHDITLKFFETWQIILYMFGKFLKKPCLKFLVAH